VLFNEDIAEGWEKLLSEYFETESFHKLHSFVMEERRSQTAFPPEGRVFSAFRLTPPEKVKVVILGQDPYHGIGQAHGLAFSVQEGVKPPPSLKNIFKELNFDLGIDIPQSGCLEKWAEQGVLLLNTVMTVRQSSAGSHRRKGWEEFTDFAIKIVAEKLSPSVFMLWGADAQKKEDLIDGKKNLILKAAHPSPFSAHRGFLGCRHFSKANEFLKQQGVEEIDWSL